MRDMPHQYILIEAAADPKECFLTTVYCAVKFSVSEFFGKIQISDINIPKTKQIISFLSSVNICNLIGINNIRV